jgi:hypothetical protein
LTEFAEIRFCAACRTEVFHVGTDVGRARDLAEEGKCVAIDPTVSVAPGSLRRERTALGSVSLPSVNRRA